MKVSLVAPVYNDEHGIQEFIRRSAITLRKISDDLEIVLVDDASLDKTILKIKEVQNDYPEVRLIKLSQNSGQHISTSIALKESKGDFVFLMDSDLQVAPEYMEDFFNCMKGPENIDIVSALRLSRSKSLYRKLGSNVISKLIQIISKTKLKDPGSTFKLFSRKAVDRMLANDILIQNYPILMLNMNFKIHEQPIEYNTDQVRESNYGILDLIGVITLAILNYTTGTLTLVIVMALGMISGFIGTTGFIVSVIWGMINSSQLPTNYFIFFLILIVIGIQFILMGMIVFKLERINVNLNFRRSVSQRIIHEN